MSEWRPSADPGLLRKRARILADIRQFFRDRDVVEVDTPVLTRSGVTDPQIESIPAGRGKAWLRTSPEYWHKRLLAAGLGDLYELGPVFRAGESGHLNQVEFTLLEWYRLGWTWRELAEEVIELITACLGVRRDTVTVRHLPWRDAFRERLGFDPLTASDSEITACARDAPDGCNRDMLLDYLFATRVQPGMTPGAITVIFDYPASQAALARLNPDDGRVAERFEVFFGPVELANGYRELTDGIHQKARFEADNRLRAELGRAPMPIDAELLAALDSGLPECSGVALGVDRLIMLALDGNDIRQIMAFPSPDPG